MKKRKRLLLIVNCVMMMMMKEVHILEDLVQFQELTQEDYHGCKNNQKKERGRRG